VLQFNIARTPPVELADKTALLLIGTAVVEAMRQEVPLSAVEVIYYTADSSSYFGWVGVNPWGSENVFFSPMDPALAEEYERGGATPITPTPTPTATPAGGAL